MLKTTKTQRIKIKFVWTGNKNLEQFLRWIQTCWSLTGFTSLTISILIINNFYYFTICLKIICVKIYISKFLDAVTMKVSPTVYLRYNTEE